MANVEQTRKEEHGGLSVARTEFASSLARRLEAIQSAIVTFEQQATSPARRDNLIRRLHALGASAKVLGFAAAAESLSRAEQQLRTGLAETLIEDLAVVRNQLATLPTLVLRGTYSMLPAPPSFQPGPSASPSPLAQGPWCVLVFGSAALADTLRSVGAASSGFELIHGQDSTRLREMCAMYGPDVVVLDGALDQLEEHLLTLKDAPETAGVELIVMQAEEGASPELKCMGAHTVIASSATPMALWRALNRTRSEDYDLPPAREPFGDVPLRDLCERVSREIRRGLLEAADAEAQSTVISLGEGIEVRAAIWAAVARIREIVVAQSDGRVQFGPGPEGSVVLAPGPGLGLRGRVLADSASIDLTGRRIVVADDDPAVAWFVGGTLRAAGADVREVHDGRRALNLVQQWWPELVVSDVLMPGLDGFALCREIKRDVVLRDVPVILLSWKEDLLFRLRELGADADGYLRKEASASALVERVRELLWPRISLERRLRTGQEVRGRLDGIAPRSLIEAACGLGRSLRIALRDSSAHFDVRIRDNTLRAITRTRVNGVVERGQAALGLLLGVSAGRFSVVADDQPSDDDFTEPNLNEVLRTPILRARAAQRVLSGSALGTVERVTLDPETFADELSMLPLSLRPLVDELLRGTAPRQLLASGAASLRGLESLLSDAARRGAVRGITGSLGEDLLTREILALSAPNSEHPPAEVSPPPPPLFSFQISPSPLPVTQTSSPIANSGLGPASTQSSDSLDGFDWTAEASWEVDLPSDSEASVRAERSSPFSRPRFSAEWGAEKRTSPGVGTHGSARKVTPDGAATSQNQRSPDIKASRVASESIKEMVLNETPELSQVVAAAIAVDVGHDLTDSKADTRASAPQPFDRSAAISSSGTAITNDPQAPIPAAQLRPVVSPPRPAHPVEISERGNSTSTAQEPIVSATGEEEAIFPLFPSGAPDKKRTTPRPGVMSSPVVAINTMPSELAPRPDAKYSNSDGPSISQPSELSDNLAPKASAEAVEGVPTAGDSEPHTNVAESDPKGPDSGSSREFGREVPDEAPASIEDNASDTDQSAPAKVRSWLAPLSLAITTGLLSFTVALPIMQRCQATRVHAPANSSPSQTTVEASENSTTLAVSANPTVSAAAALPSVAEAPPGIVVPADKGLVVVKTGGVHSIFVDDEFIGRGPERVATLGAGPHKVRVSLNGEEHTETVNIVVGRVVEFSLEQPGK
jgi:CheY-like chemotaxis protein/HPt (histidine-containing phosphotransfer) domain-containing protein